jgi:carbamoyltransferase
MLTLGINAYHGDVSAALLHDDELVAAVEEERFRRVKHWAGFPELAIRSCLSMAGASGADIDAFAISRDPRAHLLRKAWFVVTRRPSRATLGDRARNLGRVRSVAAMLARTLNVPESRVKERLHRVEHHPAHLASSFFVSPFESATLCAIDGFGDFVSTSVAIGVGRKLDIVERVYFPHSLGLLYLAVTQWLGFPKYGDEFKVMGLAPYGEPRFADRIRQLVHLTADGGFQLDLSFFRHASDGVEMTWTEGEPSLGPVFTPKLEALLGPARRLDEPLAPVHEAVAASVQQVFEEAAFHVLNGAYRRVGLPRLCLAGGCAMNSVANGKILERTPFREVYIQPAAADNGTALGAALYTRMRFAKATRRDFVMSHSYWGPEFADAAIAAAIEERRDEILRQRCRLCAIDGLPALCEWTARHIASGRIVGWFQGRMEWGARALGNRSILADPRRPDMRDVINTKIKFREKFRPFAPSVLVEALADYFVGAAPDPFMIQVFPVRPDKRAIIPAVTHVDGSGRLQTVDRGGNPVYWMLIDRFRQITGVPILLNTSFNENEPIVLKPAEALDCFLRTRMDVLVMGRHTFVKGDTPELPAM